MTVAPERLNCFGGKLLRPPLELADARQPLLLIELGEHRLRVILGKRIEVWHCTESTADEIG